MKYDSFSQKELYLESWISFSDISIRILIKNEKTTTVYVYYNDKENKCITIKNLRK